jgi:outer membrane protein OmpA-like peptidoglycan-associated protein
MRISLAVVVVASGVAQAAPVTEDAACSYVASAFISTVAPAALSPNVRVEPALRRQLALPEGASRDAVYRALVAMTDGMPIRVHPLRKAVPERPDEATLAVEAGERVRLVVRYDLRANAVVYVGLPESPAGAEKRALKLAAVPRPAAPRVVALPPVNFAFNRAVVGEEAAAMLEDRLAQTLRRASSVRITGRADPLGPADYNVRLSEERAQAVRERLVALGVDPARIEVTAAGAVALGQCADVQPRSARIACLAPERRVDIVVELAEP